MDKSRNRSDLLAAGRKKLDQFRQKGKNKGSSHGKSSDKVSRSEQDGWLTETGSPVPHIDAEMVAVDSSVLPSALPKASDGETLSVDADQETQEGEKDRPLFQEGFNEGKQNDTEPIGIGSDNAELPSQNIEADQPTNENLLVRFEDSSTISTPTISAQIVEDHYISIPASDHTGTPSSVEHDTEQINGSSEGFVLLVSQEGSSPEKEASVASNDLHFSTIVDQEANDLGLDRHDETGVAVDRGDIANAEVWLSPASVHTFCDDSVEVGKEGRNGSSQEKEIECDPVACSSGVEGESLGAGCSSLENKGLEFGGRLGYEHEAANESLMVAAPETALVTEGVVLLSPRLYEVQEMDGFSVSDANGPLIDPCTPKLDSEVNHEADGTSAIEHTGQSELQQENKGLESLCKGRLEPCVEFGTSGEDKGQANKLPLDEFDKELHGDGTIITNHNGSMDMVELGNIELSGGEAISIVKDIGFSIQEEVGFLLESRESDLRDMEHGIPADALKLSNSCSGSNNGRIITNGQEGEAGFFNGLDRLKQQLYLNCVAKDFLQLQLVEQNQVLLQFDKQDHQSLDDVSNHRPLDGDMDSKTSITEELYQCKSELGTMAARKEELETQYLSARGEIEELNVRTSELHNKLESSEAKVSQLSSELAELQSKLEFSGEKVSQLSFELANCRGLLGSLQAENVSLPVNLDLVTEELDRNIHEATWRKKLEEENDMLANENSRLLSQLHEHSEHNVYEKQVQFEDDLKEAMVCIEQLIEENLYLSCSLDIHKAKVKEIKGSFLQLFNQAGETRNLLGSFNSRNCIPVSDPISEGKCLHLYPEREVVPEHRGASSGEPGSDTDGIRDSQLHDGKYDSESIIMKGRLDEAWKIIQRLETTIQGMSSDSASLSGPSGKAPSGGSGVTKIIQAFELKTHRDGTLLEDVSATVRERSEDHPEKVDRNTTITGGHDASSVTGWLKLAKEEVSNLRSALKQLGLDVDKVIELLKEEQSSKKLVIITLRDVEVEFETQKQQKDYLKAKLLENQARMKDIHNQFHELQRNADEMAGMLLNRVDSLHKEVAERGFILEQERNSGLAVILEAVGKLDQFAQLGSSRSNQPDNLFDAGVSLTCAVSAATEAIEELRDKLQTAYKDGAGQCASYEELDKKFTAVHVQNEFAIALLDKIYGIIRKLVKDSCGVGVETEMEVKCEEMLDLLPANFEMLTVQLQKLLDDRLFLQSAKDELELELLGRTREIEDLNTRYHDLADYLNAQLESIDKLIEAVEDVEPEDVVTDSDKQPLVHLEALVSSVLKKYKEEVRSNAIELNQLQEEMQHLSSLKLQHEDEISILKESLFKMEEALTVAHSELSTKESELEQSEQRFSAVREKLGIAVAKGKGLVVQRDTLKQSLADKSSDLEKLWQELQLKNAMLHEVEMKLKTYSEGGERIEALESELSYIRNSATALRESFLQKDSVLQRIEEILEDLELPEHFHSRDIIDKIEWLARSVIGNSLPLGDWDQKTDGVGSYSGVDFVVTDTCKEDREPNSNPGFEDLRVKYEELQSKFFGLAEQTDMLEQSLLERNNLVQRWEEVLDGVEIPLPLRSKEPEDKIEWLGRALSEAQHERHSLQLKVENLKTSSSSLIANLEEAQKKICDQEAVVVALTCEKELLSANLEKLTCEREKTVKNADQDEHDEALRRELAELQERVLKQNVVVKPENNEYCDVETEINKLQSTVDDELVDRDIADVSLNNSNFACLERALEKLIENYTVLSVEKSMLEVIEKANGSQKPDASLEEQRMKDELDAKERDLVTLKKDLEEALGMLALVKEERDKTLGQCEFLMAEIKAIGKERVDLQEQLNQEEQKSASAREKLSVAVRKGKGLVQQRDSMKQIIGETNAKLEQLKSELHWRDNALREYEQKEVHFSAYPEKLETLSSENFFLRNQLEENKQRLEDHKQEAIKSKRAAELLLAELNEVQDRFDSLQEELATAETAYAELSKQKESAEVAKVEALSRLEKTVGAYSEERKSQQIKVMELNDGICHLWEDFCSLSNLLDNAFLKMLELLDDVEAGAESFLNQISSTKATELPCNHASDGVFFHNLVKEENFYGIKNMSELQLQEHGDCVIADESFGLVGHCLEKCAKGIAGLKERFQRQSNDFDQKAARLLKIMDTVQRDVAFHKESSDILKRETTRLEAMQKEKDTDISAMHRTIALLYEACNYSILEIENQIAQVLGNGLPSEMSLKLPLCSDGQEYLGNALFTEEYIRTTANALLSAVKDLTSIQVDMVEGSQRELRATISQLQKEVEEKDIQNNRICADLVTQIRAAEAVANTYSLDIDSAKTQVHNLEKQVEELENECHLLELRVNELKDLESSSKELQDSVGSLTDMLATKEQEIEALMQALDEEESQMEGLTSRIEELEKTVQHKNLALEGLEASRAKVVAKLSTTVNKFNELHHLSGSLLSEVENLQSQLQGRDAEISFLRQEVTRCTNDILASQESNKLSSTEVHELLTWFDSMASCFGVHDMNLDDKMSARVDAYTDFLGKQIAFVMSELEDLRAMVKSKDALLQTENSRIEGLSHKVEVLEISLREKESQIELLQETRDSGKLVDLNPAEPLDVEQMGQRNKRAVALSAIAPHVRSGRKVTNDHVSLGIDIESGNTTLDNEDDDKGHGFRSLTTSRIVPRLSRPISDKIDGMWVSGGRILMREPTLRLGIVVYWVILHLMVATSIF